MSEQQAKHTPGPWRASGRHSLDIPIRAVDQEALGISIVFLNTSDQAKKGEAKANARLIAAAPCLLAALQACIPFIDDANEVTQFFPESAASNACREAVKQARAAIARALPQGAHHEK